MGKSVAITRLDLSADDLRCRAQRAGSIEAARRMLALALVLEERPAGCGRGFVATVDRYLHTEANVSLGQYRGERFGDEPRAPIHRHSNCNERRFFCHEFSTASAQSLEKRGLVVSLPGSCEAD